MNEVSGSSDDERLDLVVDYLRKVPVPPCPLIELTDQPSVLAPRRSPNYQRASMICILALIAIIVVVALWVPDFVGSSGQRNIVVKSQVQHESPALPTIADPSIPLALPVGLTTRSPIVEIALDSEAVRTKMRRDISTLVAGLDRLAKRRVLQDARGRAQDLVRSIQRLVASTD